jgi:glycosyltransferase involved in cell wall biosynthesis
MAHLFVCIPALNEAETLPRTLECLEVQTLKSFTTIVCVNQPEAWWEDPEQHPKCMNNAETLRFLSSYTSMPVITLDRSSHGRGWQAGRSGVGHARKYIMDHALTLAATDDIIVSLDADTTFGPEYLQAVHESLANAKGIAALSVPYYHRLTGEERADRAILRYEIYMRNYAWNLYRIRNPYAFTALGSALAVPVRAYRAIGGLTPKQSGEDFYFLQKLRKYGSILNTCPEKVYPAARFSDRVNFGTGPAMIKGDAGDWESYPIYSSALFDDIRDAYGQFRWLFPSDNEIQLHSFITETMGDKDLFPSLRQNFNTESKFVRACWEKFDALRILQYLKSHQKDLPGTDEDHLRALFAHPEFSGNPSLLPDDLLFSTAPIALLDEIRNTLMNEEERMMHRHMNGPP